ncbi:MAG: bifunctional [glutamate--ammonia ligase]-adenylyl-L-tyrosine phosphorylase/[glutamate--ammonia-ligase] adenylyltransferase [Halofilum sp. (in: g-proteobacteria)]|nr:bifunctional [glutamate--ammonia ligase]-adenylyl-L-tyrosine phosphorylase/[glutamate--ammonia-ligase] adenylyltransferase [Halofilum sp. (in: g-proteobacteria)]
MSPRSAAPARSASLAATPPPGALDAAGERALAAFEAAAAAAAVTLPGGDWRGEARAVFAASDLVARYAAQQPAELADLLTGPLDAAMAAADLEAALRARLGSGVDTGEADEATLARVLRRFRRRESVRIAWRDLAGRAAIDDTLAEQSALADACIRVALEVLDTRARARFGTPRSGDGEPQALLVLAMGKLGGHELNFSSDVDLVFVYGERGETDGARALDNGDFFTRLGQELIRVLEEATVDGFAFRVDMRLRPFGGSGPLVVHLDQLEQYLVTQAREWERFALVKARAITGDAATVAGVEELLRPFVYRRYLDFGAFEALRDLKARLEREVERKGLHGNVKYGRGGIREVEFIAQAFQLIRGGREPRLRTRGLVDALAALRELGELDGDTVDALAAAYRYLRCVENRLQAWADERVHALPRDDEARARLAWTMGAAGWDAFAAELGVHMERVQECFGHVFNVPDEEAAAGTGRDPFAAVWEGELEGGAAEHELAAAGYGDPGEVRRRLEAVRRSSRYRTLSATARDRFDRLMPRLLEEAGESAAPERTLGRLLTLMEAVARRSVYLSLLSEHAAARARLVELCAASAWIADFVTRHPILLDELIDPRSLFEPPDRASVEAEIGAALEGVGGDDLEAQMDALRQVKQANVLRVAAVDITGRLPLMRVSDHLTWIAEAVLDAAHRLVYRQAVARYGRPWAVLDGSTREPEFGIVAYGKLGGIELGYGSDLDLVFLHEGGEDRGTDGERPVDTGTFFARLAQRLVHFLNTPTPAGTLYEIDTRLRPNGSAGLLVSSLPAFERYQGEQAWTWEHQALVRARMIVGGDDLRARFEAVRAGILRQARERAALARSVLDMRNRMVRELARGGADRLDLKQDRGGVADIEFMVQYGVLAGAHATPALVEYTDNIRLLEALAEAGELGADEANLLTDAYRAFRTRIHRLALLDEPALVEPDAELAGYRDAVARIWGEWLEAAAADAAPAPPGDHS